MAASFAEGIGCDHANPSERKLRCTALYSGTYRDLDLGDFKGLCEHSTNRNHLKCLRVSLRKGRESLSPRIKRHEPMGRLVVGDQLGGGGYAGGAVGGWVRVAAVVEDDVGGLALAVK